WRRPYRDAEAESLRRSLRGDKDSFFNAVCEAVFGLVDGVVRVRRAGHVQAQQRARPVQEVNKDGQEGREGLERLEGQEGEGKGKEGVEERRRPARQSGIQRAPGKPMAMQASPVPAVVDVGRIFDEGRASRYQRQVVALTALGVVIDGIDSQLLGIAAPS